MGCPICGKVMCDHTPAERGQTIEEMMGLSPQQQKEISENIANDIGKIPESEWKTKEEWAKEGVVIKDEESFDVTDMFKKAP